MASEIRYSISFQLNNGNNSYNYQKSVAVDQLSAGGPSPGTVTIGTTEETVSLTELGNEGLAVLINLDATNYVDIGSAAGNYTLRLLPGEPQLVRLVPGLTLRARANAAPCLVAFNIFEA